MSSVEVYYSIKHPAMQKMLPVHKFYYAPIDQMVYCFIERRYSVNCCVSVMPDNGADNIVPDDDFVNIIDLLTPSVLKIACSGNPKLLDAMSKKELWWKPITTKRCCRVFSVPVYGLAEGNRIIRSAFSMQNVGEYVVYTCLEAKAVDYMRTILHRTLRAAKHDLRITEEDQAESVKRVFNLQQAKITHQNRVQELSQIINSVEPQGGAA